MLRRRFGSKEPFWHPKVPICLPVSSFPLYFPDDQKIPPVMAFGMGALGFLTPFDVANHEAAHADVGFLLPPLRKPPHISNPLLIGGRRIFFSRSCFDVRLLMGGCLVKNHRVPGKDPGVSWWENTYFLIRRLYFLFFSPNPGVAFR